MSPATRQRWLLAALAVLLTIWGWRLLSGSDGTPTRRGPRTVARAERQLPQVTALHLEALEPTPGEFHPGRDIFRYGDQGQRPVPAALPPPEPVAPSAQPAEEVPPPLPVVDLRFLGSFGPSSDPIAAFADEKGIYNLRVGEVVAGVLRLESIGYESADLSYVDRPEAEPLRLPAGG